MTGAPMKSKAAISMMLLLIVAGCGRKAEIANPPPAQVENAAAPATAPQAKILDIEWFGGSIDSAFAAAAEQHKHVFLYWGAVWCPPCHELKAYVFTRPDFRDKLKQFIPVYLDGDAPGAQKLAETFGVVGYPSVVVLRADRTEVARIGGGMDLSRYADVLDLALDDAHPLPQILAELKSNPQRMLSEDECKRIAYNGWEIDKRSDDPGPLAAALNSASMNCPESAQTERDRLLISAAGFEASAERAGIEKGRRPTELLHTLISQVGVLIGDTQRSLRNADVLMYLGEDYFVVAARLLPENREKLLKKWIALLSALESDPRYDDALRLESVAIKLQAAQGLGSSKQLPPELLADAHRSLDEFMAKKYDEHGHVSMINSALWVTHYLGDDERTRAILEKEIADSKTPYYYMLDMADLEESSAHKTEALNWLQRAYETSSGTATRFQWGMRYVDGLMRLSPTDKARIESASVQVLAELDGTDRIHQRTRMRLDKFGKSLRAWGKQPGHADALAAIDAHWRDICSRVPASDPVSGQCVKILTVG
jgi:protein disulfide-isomerase